MTLVGNSIPLLEWKSMTVIQRMVGRVGLPGGVHVMILLVESNMFLESMRTLNQKMEVQSKSPRKEQVVIAILILVVQVMMNLRNKDPTLRSEGTRRLISIRNNTMIVLSPILRQMAKRQSGGGRKKRG